MRILQLPPAIANQIAAGEVIERPASVMKELLENSFDAGADMISIEIVHAGLNQIKVSDNGVGIMAEDLPLAVAAHATSKITSLEDLYAIKTMGFRGEALASIAAVAKVSISSKTLQQNHAMMLRFTGSDIQLRSCARSVGTTVNVSQLFFNAPVRKRFLKSERLEFQAIEAVIKRFALSAPHIAITLKHNGKLILSLAEAKSPQDQQKRMLKLLGTNFVNNAIFLEVEHANMQLMGWISQQNVQRSHNDKLWVYINQRMIKDKLIFHALRQAYDGLLHPGRFPACLLYFNLPSAEVDVNVHPTKHEVRFTQPKLVHDFFSSQLRSALDSVKKTTLTLQQERQIKQPLNSLKLISNRFSGERENFDRESWVDLNHRYAIVLMKQAAYLVDVLGFFQEKIRAEISKMPLPLPKRTLLVPIYYEMNSNKIKQEIIDQLRLLGVEVEYLKNFQLVFRSIPQCIPYLDLHLLLDSISKFDNFDTVSLADLISQSQVLDSRTLSLEEKMQLKSSLSINQGMKSWSKSLTEEACRMFVYA